MTHKEIVKERRDIHNRIKELTHEVNSESNRDLLTSKCAELVECAKRISELDTLEKELVLTELQKKVDEILEKFRRR